MTAVGTYAVWQCAARQKPQAAGMCQLQRCARSNVFLTHIFEPLGLWPNQNTHNSDNSVMTPKLTMAGLSIFKGVVDRVLGPALLTLLTFCT